MASKEQLAADAGLVRALNRVVRAYDLVPEGATVVDFLEAYVGIAAEIMKGAFEAVRDGEETQRS